MANSTYYDVSGSLTKYKHGSQRSMRCLYLHLSDTDNNNVLAILVHICMHAWYMYILFSTEWTDNHIINTILKDNHNM